MVSPLLSAGAQFDNAGFDESSVANTRLIGELPALAPAASADLLTYTCPNGVRFYLIDGFGSADGNTEWLATLNGARLMIKRNSYFDRNVVLKAPIRLDAGDVLQIRATNRSFQGNSIVVGAWIYGREVTI